ncbi:hypothetical protein [Stigmatella aurantiaca]|uniref:Conserved uncharacterized protein n=1 Tax=Stigmatella aurantiaca (strain DW4/3-1) TaxID=378806 RepID=Q08RZ1_STIAD|nr:hypothetical protein [Stigmatella aurantiaca]ADO68373.1 conserved uncharacterized protein [Stigmatella aurantiaca DW4/3-1]EAU63245.1 hypothetical protein STIAU_1635 [Stigmatella aurantiaca DW4/3-1]
MHRLHMWAVLAMLGGLVGGVGLSCTKPEEAPSASEREARSQVLKNLMASRERLPEPEALDVQRRNLEVEVQGGEHTARGDAGRPLPTASTSGTVEWVGDDELLFRDEAGQEQEVRIQEDTLYVEKGREVSRWSVGQGAEVRVRYDEEQGEWVAREVELLRRASEAKAPPEKERGRVPDESRPLGIQR